MGRLERGEECGVAGLRGVSGGRYRDYCSDVFWNCYRVVVCVLSSLENGLSSLAFLRGYLMAF